MRKIKFQKTVTAGALFVLLFSMGTAVVLGIDSSAVDAHVVIADVNDVAVASSEGGPVNFTLMGFSSVPLVLDISSPLSPQILSDVQPLGETVPYGAYLGVNNAIEIYAAGEDAITEVTSLQSL